MTGVNLLSLDEVSRMARVTPRTMRRFVAAETGPRVTRIGGRIFVQEAHFKRWIAANSTSKPKA